MTRKGWRGLLASFIVAMAASAPASAQQQDKPNILFIMGDDIGWMQVGSYHQGVGLGETPNLDRIANEGARFVNLLRRAELHRRTQCLLHRHESAAHGDGPAAASRQPLVSAARNAGPRQVPVRSWLHHRRVRQEPPGRPHRRTADGAWLPGILGLPLSPRRHAAGELSRHQQEPDEQGFAPPVQEHADPGRPRGFRCRRSENDDLSDAAASRAVLQVLRRLVEESDMQRRGPADAGAVEDGGRGNFRQGHRLPRPQRPQEDQQALLRLVQPGAHARHDGAVTEVSGDAGRGRRQGLGHPGSRHEADGRQHRRGAQEARSHGPARQHDHRLHHRQRRPRARPSRTAA